MTTQQTETIWWEKTVEYLFAKLCLGESSVMPLDGNREKAGDLLVFKDSNMLIIEFKRNEESLDSEQKKFSDWSKAKEEAKQHNSNKYHLLVYGELQKEKNELSLKAKEYWERNDINELKFSESDFETYVKCNGKTFNDLKRYLDFLIKHKTPTNGTDSSGGFSNCAIVGIAKGKVKTLSLNEFIEYHQELKKALELKVSEEQAKRRTNTHKKGMSL